MTVRYFIDDTLLRVFTVVFTSFTFFCITIWVIGLNSYEKDFISTKLKGVYIKLNKKRQVTV